MFRLFRHFHPLLLCLCAALCASCGRGSSPDGGRVLRLGAGGRVNTLDPAMAEDLVSQRMSANFYDTLLQYDYTASPYKLTPSMLDGMPLRLDDSAGFEFRLRDDLFFQSDPCFGKGGREKRKITSRDVVFSILRVADPRLHSPGFWLFRDKIKGLEKFRAAAAAAPQGDFSPYDTPVEGLRVMDDRRFVVRLERPDPRFLYALAMPYAAVVSRTALEFYGGDISAHPVGSGPFRLGEYLRDYKITLLRNDDYRPEFFPAAALPSDRTRPLPLADKIECVLVQQPLSAWLLFLQGGMDISALSKDNFDAVVGDDMKLVPALARRGIQLISAPEFQTNYVGFSFSDPRLASNPNLRKALSLAYDVEKRIRLMNNRIVRANGPVPPGVAGHDPSFVNPYSGPDLEKARFYLKEAGYPGGTDPSTGAPLSFSFDQMGNSAQHRQLAELMVDDMKKIGVEIKPSLNNKPRFLQKAQKGQLQLFRLSWVGDYPDAENFLQLFYGKNIGSCNRIFFKDPAYDKMYEEAAAMEDSPARTAKYREMSARLVELCPWIFESHPISFTLVHSWVQNYRPHDFAFAGWKYLSVDDKARRAATSGFKPIEMKDLRN